MKYHKTPRGYNKKTNAFTMGLSKVHNINWCDSKICRAGVIPVCKYNGRVWIGLVLSNYSACLSDIGGIAESTDYDLLETALREFEEESGGIFGAVTADMVYNLPVIKNDMTIDILLPISGNPWEYVSMFNDKFQGFGENGSIHWFTLEQIIIMLNCNDKFEGTKTHIYAIKSCVKLGLRAAINSCISEFYTLGSMMYDAAPVITRPRKTMKLRCDEWIIHRDVIVDNIPITNNREWGFVTFVAVRDNLLVIGNSYRQVYIIDNDVDIRRTCDLIRNRTIKYVSSVSDVRYMINTLKIKSVFSTAKMLKDRKFRSDYALRIKAIRKISDPIKSGVDEVIHMITSENDSFQHIKASGVIDNTHYNSKRANYYAKINQINRFISASEPIVDDSDYTDVMIQTGILVMTDKGIDLPSPLMVCDDT